MSPSLLQITPASGAAYKLGADSAVSAIIAVKNGQAWRIASALPRGEYPEGAAGAGFPVEFYNHSDAGVGQYVELELLSPLRRFAKGSRWTPTVRWSLHSLPSGDVNALENTQTAKGTARTMHVAQPVPRSTSGGNPMVCRMERLSSKDSEAKGSAMVFWNWPNSHNATASALCL